MKEMKRVLALLLCLVLVAVMLPINTVTAWAEVDGTATQSNSDPVVVVAASDFQQNDGHKVSDSVMESIIKAMTDAGYTDVDGAIFCGDYSNYMTAADSNEGLSYVYGNYNGTWGLDYDDIVFVQGNHDPAATTYLAESGENDPDSGAYGVFVINEDDYGWASGDYGKSESDIKQTAANLKKYLDAKLEAKFDAPIFIASHLPLHYSMRTYNDGDCQYAQYIFDVLNEASEAGLNIIYLYGHNHSQSFDNYHGGGAVFYSAGDEILIGDTANKKTHHIETIQFTYLNAGFTGRFDPEDTADPTNTGTVYEIYDDKVVISRFDANGTHKLKSAGVQSKKYSTEASLYAPNDRVETSPQTIELKQFEPDPTVVDEATGITVTAPGLTGITVKKIENPTYDTERYSAYASYDVTLTGYTQGDTATVTIPAPADFDASKPAVVLDAGNVIVKDTNISDGITFTTNHFSEYDVAQYAATEVENWVEIPGETTYTYTQANSITSNEKYVIVGNNNDVALMDNNGTMGSQNVTISGSTMTSDTALTEWTFSDNSNGTVYNGTRYLRYNSSYIGGGSFSLSNSSYTLTFTDNGSNFRIYDDGRLFDSSFYYDGSQWTLSIISTQYVRLYQYTNTNTTVGGYAGMAGQTNYSLVTGRYADQAAVVDMIKNNITVYTATEADGSDAAETKDYQITGHVDPSAEGDYTLFVTYEGKTLGIITVNVSDKTATNIEVDPMVGSVERGSGKSATTGSTMTVTYDDGTSETIPVTVSMLSGTYNLKKNGTYTGLSITYAGMTVENYTLNVVDVVGNDFPSYPEGGSINVTKTATGQDFQNTGVARVELSTSGLPSKKGVDVIVMLDTSSSMTSNNVDNGTQTRAAALRESLANLVGQLQEDGPDGEPMDIKIAIADFNGYYVSDTNTTRPYNLETKDHLKGTTVKSTTDNFGAEIYTGTGDLTAGAFVDVHDIVGQTVANALNFQSGTNYDYAFDAVYQLGEAIQAANEEERDLYVIFMSDGGPFQYNYFSTQSEANNGGDLWNHWMTGTVVDSDWDDKTHSYFYNPEGKHWMAEAIKGDPSQNYTVIRKNATEFIDVTGDGVADQYMTQVPGLGATMYSIGFCAKKDDNAIKASSIEYVLKNIASNESLYHTANDGDDLNGIFSNIASAIRYAAQNAVFEDQMGTAFDLQMNPTIKKSDGTTTTDISTDITVTEYPIYTKADYEARKCAADDIGKTYGDGTVTETVKFTSDTAATSTALPDEPNIIKDGVICANTFFYNTTTSIKTITLANGTKYDLPGETFYWNIGIINEKQFTLSYAVYLTGSIDGTTLPNDSYPTNNYATLSYTNWLGNDVKQQVASPAMAWGAANVSYCFYLVDGNGNPLTQNGSPADNFLTSYKVTDIVFYKQILLNSGETVLSTVADDVLPDGYTLYDTNAVYKVTVNSGNGGGSWTITGDHPDSTYVMGYAGADDYSNATPVNETSYDYTHTIVYFAVEWTIGTVPDTVVIDYGLPVDINVMANDMFGNYGTLVGVGETAGTLTNSSGFGDTYTGKYGTATLNNGKVRYTPANMQMNGYDKFAYAVYYIDSSTDTSKPNNSGYYYGTVTVIPATTIYYEDDFVTLKTFKATETDEDGNPVYEEHAGWSVPEATDGDITQNEDRPGKYSLGQFDANNVYGYDGAYANMSTYSLDSTAKVHVDANSYATAEFTFYGTGFDVISMTSNQTGVLRVRVYAAEDIGDYKAGDRVKSVVVDTYYGYSQKADGEWETDVNNPEALYQVPVMKIQDLPYGKYNVEITATYVEAMDHTGADGYDLYLDAIRIYDPANDGASDGSEDTTIEDAYIADGEGWPVYEELRNNIIAASNYTVTENNDGTVTVTGTNLSGAIFIDSNDNNYSIADYVSYGPNNELYLAKDQAIAFNVITDNVADVQLGIKVGNGGSVTYAINGDEKIVNTATDMYYSILSYAKADTVVIKNVSGGILSLTNIKVTYTQDPSTPSTTGLIWMDDSSAGYALKSLRAPVAEEEIPEETEPEVTEPEENKPEDTKNPGNTVGNIVSNINTVIDKVVTDAINWLTSWLRR